MNDKQSNPCGVTYPTTIPPSSPFSNMPEAQWAPKTTSSRFKTLLQAEAHIAAIEEKLRTNKAMVDHLCKECGQQKKEIERLRIDLIQVSNRCASLLASELHPIEGINKKVVEVISKEAFESANLNR